jgi:hypothetical protein
MPEVRCRCSVRTNGRWNCHGQRLIHWVAPTTAWTGDKPVPSPLKHCSYICEIRYPLYRLYVVNNWRIYYSGLICCSQNKHRDYTWNYRPGWRKSYDLSAVYRSKKPTWKLVTSRTDFPRVVVMKGSSMSWDIISWSSLKIKSRALLAACFQADFLFGLFIDPEDGDGMFLRNVGWLSTEHMVLYSRRQNSS